MSNDTLLPPCLITVEPGCRYWEHLLRDAADYRAHLDYVHINPVKHGLVERVADWPCSTFHRLVADGVYPLDWAGGFESGVGYED